MKLLMTTVASVALCVTSLSAFAMTTADYNGDAASPVSTERTIVVGASTRAVNMVRGEIVQIVFNGQEFEWHFDGTLPSFDLNQILPHGTINQKVTVYIAPAPYEAGSGE